MILEIHKEQQIYRKRQKRKSWVKKRNFYLNSLPKEERRLYTENGLFKFGNLITLNVPKFFSTSIDVETVLSFIAKGKSLNITIHNLLFFNFKKVEKVNAGALSLLLSVVQDLTDLKIKIKGNLPIDKDARKEFIESGFLEYFYDNKGRKASCKNKIFVQVRGGTDQIRTAEELKKAMFTVFKISKFNTLVQGALIEMMANAVNHAFPESNDGNSYFFEPFIKNKRCYFSVSHDFENKKVYFSFIDNGIGILKTIKRGPFQKIVDNLDSTQILKNAFNGHYRSSTKQEERGRGLPTIQDAYSKNAMKNLKVITNDYYYSFENCSGLKLTNTFDGTFYLWILDETCYHGIIKD